MNRSNFFILIAIASFIAGIGVGCTVGFDAEQSDVFPCTEDDECISGFECGPNNFCRSIVNTGNIGNCIDGDGDGYGVGEAEDLQSCPACTEGRVDGCLVADCDDTAENVNPGAGEVCDGVDNNCNEEVDEPTTCDNVGDCPNEGADYQASCESGSCEYKPFLQVTAECREPLLCMGGVREPVPPACQ
jgi:hypothetical protein